MFDLDISQYVVLVTVIAGVTELITRLRAKDYWVAVTIASSVLVGFLFGLIHYYANVGPVEGVALGFAASGIITVVGAVKSRATPSSPVEKV
jgi:uncharacterized membrane protein HdeD (DUF308 family)